MRPSGSCLCPGDRPSTKSRGAALDTGPSSGWCPCCSPTQGQPQYPECGHLPQLRVGWRTKLTDNRDGPDLGPPHSIHCEPIALADDPGAQDIASTSYCLTQAIAPMLQEDRRPDGLSGSQHATMRSSAYDCNSPSVQCRR